MMIMPDGARAGQRGPETGDDTGPGQRTAPRRNMPARQAGSEGSATCHRALLRQVEVEVLDQEELGDGERQPGNDAEGEDGCAERMRLCEDGDRADRCGEQAGEGEPGLVQGSAEPGIAIEIEDEPEPCEGAEQVGAAVDGGKALVPQACRSSPGHGDEAAGAEQKRRGAASFPADDRGEHGIEACAAEQQDGPGRHRLLRAGGGPWHP